MNGSEAVELLVRVERERTLLLSPGVGIFSGALGASSPVSPGHAAGCLTTLGKRARLVIPADVRGVVYSSPPDRLHAPVEYGQVLYEIAVGTVPGTTSTSSSRADVEVVPGTVPTSVLSPLSGRFYHRSAPGEASMCEVGRAIEVGTPIGLIEVMKTFTQVVYRAERGLPARAKIQRVVASDGSDVEEGSILIVVEGR